MAVKFLSEDWMSAIADAANADEGFTNASSGVTLSLQFKVTDVPDEDDIDYYLTIGEDGASAGSGMHEAADATITNSYETAAAISKGELNTQMAFMTGKLKVQGNMAMLMMNQSALNQFAKAVADVDVEYE